MHRSYGATGHFYSNDIREASSWGFTLEAADYFYTEQSKVGVFTAPLNRCVIDSTGRRYLSTSPNCEGAGRLETVLGYMASSAQPNTVPLYRLMSTKANDHLETISQAEVQSAQAQGYVFEAVLGYVFTSSGIAWGGGPIQ